MIRTEISEIENRKIEKINQKLFPLKKINELDKTFS